MFLSRTTSPSKSLILGSRSNARNRSGRCLSHTLLVLFPGLIEPQSSPRPHIITAPLFLTICTTLFTKSVKNFHAICPYFHFPNSFGYNSIFQGLYAHCRVYIPALPHFYKLDSNHKLSGLPHSPPRPSDLFAPSPYTFPFYGKAASSFITKHSLTT